MWANGWVFRGARPRCTRCRTRPAPRIGVDIGGSNIRVSLTDVRGRLLAETRAADVGHRRRGHRPAGGAPRAPGHRRHALRGRARPAWWASRSPASSTPTAPPCTTPGTSGRPDPFDLRTPAARRRCRTEVLLDNNVNLAAIGEQWQGAAQQLQTFAVIAVGAGVGAGIVHAGQLLRGAHGAAGEVAFLPLSPDYRRRRAASPDEAGGLILLRKAQAAARLGRGPAAHQRRGAVPAGSRPARHQESRWSRRRAGGSPPSPPRSAPSSTPRRSSSPAVSARTRPWSRAPASWSTSWPPSRRPWSARHLGDTGQPRRRHGPGPAQDPGEPHRRPGRAQRRRPVRSPCRDRTDPPRGSVPQHLGTLLSCCACGSCSWSPWGATPDRRRRPGGRTPCGGSRTGRPVPGGGSRWLRTTRTDTCWLSARRPWPSTCPARPGRPGSRPSSPRW